MRFNFDEKKTSPDLRLLNLTSEALEYIESNLCNPLSVKDVTEQFEKSHWLFQRLFSSVVGIPVGQYIRERRLTEACNDLLDCKYRVIDVAVKYGFSSEEAFSRSFKSFFSVNPSTFRESKNFVLREKRHRITPEELSFFWNKIQRVPKLVSLEDKTVVGTSIDFTSHFILGSHCHLKIVPHWAEFKKRMHLVKNRVDDCRIGAILSTELELRDEKLTYFSGVEVSFAGDIPEGMHSIQLEGGLFACFENQSVSDKHSHLVDYIYGIWLPNSGFKRRPGFDFEVFDQRYVAGDPNSISNFYIPISKI